MPDNNLPPSGPVDVTAPLPTEEALIEDISNLLGDPDEPEPVKEVPEAAPIEDDDPLGLAEDVEEPELEEPDDPEKEVKGGRFAPHTAKVTRPDGTQTTVDELLRNEMFQRDYTQKRQVESEAAKAVSAKDAELSQYAQQLDQSREYLAWYAEQFLPKQPQPFAGDARTDPQGFLEWQQDVAKWQAHAQAWQQFQQSKQDTEQRQSGETQKQSQERQKRERDALMTAIPVLKDPVKGPKVWANIVAGATQHYGLNPEEVNSLTSHKAILVLRDALAYRANKASASKVLAEVRKPVIRDGRRQAPNASNTREKQARTERLRNSGSFEDGVAALQDFDL